MPIQKETFKPPTAREILPVHKLLVEAYGSRRVKKRDPLDGLILIILSQATNDVNCERAFSNLKNQFPAWERVLAAPVEKVADAIRMGGLANQKAERIKQLLQEIWNEQGSFDLTWMFNATPQKCREYWSKFRGVGPKTVACVLVFFLDKPAFPVDTHVLRVAGRLGWLRPRSGAEEAHRVLEAAVPDACKLDLHVNLISHGRAICRAKGNGGPRCGECFLQKYCAFGQEQKLDDHVPHLKAAKKRKDFFVTVES